MTNQELKEIKSALIKEGKKVSSFPLADSLTGNEKVPIIQGGKNVVVPASEFMKGNSSSVEGNDNIIILPLEFTSSNDEEKTITREEYNIIESAINSDKIVYIKLGNSYVIPSNYAKIENYITFMYYEGINERYNYNVYQITITEQDENTLLCSHSYVNKTVQKELKSGLNIKTINGQSILGNGNINVNESGEVTQSYYDCVFEYETGDIITNDEFNEIYNKISNGCTPKLKTKDNGFVIFNVGSVTDTRIELSTPILNSEFLYYFISIYKDSENDNYVFDYGEDNN